MNAFLILILILISLPLSASVGGVVSLGIYTVLLLKLYSYQDTNRWCRQIRQEKAKKLRRSYSCKCGRQQAATIGVGVGSDGGVAAPLRSKSAGGAKSTLENLGQYIRSWLKTFVCAG